MGLGSLVIAHGGAITGDEIAVIVGGTVLLAGAIAFGSRHPRAGRSEQSDDDAISGR